MTYTLPLRQKKPTFLNISIFSYSISGLCFCLFILLLLGGGIYVNIWISNGFCLRKYDSMFNSKGRKQIEEKISREKEEEQFSELKKDMSLGIEGFQIYQIWIPNTRGLDGRRPRWSQRSQENQVMRNENFSWLVRLIWESEFNLRRPQCSWKLYPSPTDNHSQPLV